jgi:hypothetical protein
MAEVIQIRSKPGNKKKFKDANEFLKKYHEYVDWIFANGFEEVVTWTGFAKYANCGRKTIYRMFDENPGLKEKTMLATADCLMTGAIKGAYKSTPAIFALKNRCNWVDKVESRNVDGNKKVATKEQADEALEKYLARKAQ